MLIESGYYNMNILSSDWLGTDLLGEFNKGDFKPFRLVERLLKFTIIIIKVVNCFVRDKSITRTKPANNVNIKEIEKHIL